MTAPLTVTVAQAVELTGMSESSLKRAIKRPVNPLPAKRLTPGPKGKLYIRLADLEAWLEGLEDAE